MTKKQDKILAEIQKQIEDFKQINVENKEINEILKEQALINAQMIISFNKKIPEDMCR